MPEQMRVLVELRKWGSTGVRPMISVDSYDGQVDGMGGSGNRDGNYRTLYKQDGQYWIGSRSTNFA